MPYFDFIQQLLVSTQQLLVSIQQLLVSTEQLLVSTQQLLVSTQQLLVNKTKRHGIFIISILHNSHSVNQKILY